MLGTTMARAMTSKGGKVRVKGDPRSFAEIGRKAAKEAQRAALLDSLGRNGWNLAAVARELDMGDSSNVRRAIDAVGLSEHYERAKADGLVKPGRPSSEESG